MKRPKMRASWLLVFLPVSCIQPPTSFADDAGAAGSDGNHADEEAEVTGSDCVIAAKSRVTLCTSISLCEDLAVDHDAYRAATGKLLEYNGFRFRNAPPFTGVWKFT